MSRRVVLPSGVSVYDPERMIVSGLHARGDVHQGSDLDLLIIKESSEPFGRRLDAVLDLCDGEMPVERRVYTPAQIARMYAENNDVISTALAEGVTVYKKKQHSIRRVQ